MKALPYDWRDVMPIIVGRDADDRLILHVNFVPMILLIVILVLVLS